MNPTADLADTIARTYRETTGMELAEGLGSLLAPDAQASAFTGGDPRWSGREDILEQWLRPEFTRHPDFRKIVGCVWTCGRDIAIFHKNACTAPSGATAEWLGLDVYRVAGGRISEARFCNDTIARSQLDRTVNAAPMWETIDERWSPTTTAANRVGMRQVVELKSVTRRSSQERYEHLVSLFEADVELWSWEVNELLHLQGRDAVRDEFIAPLFPLLPDFYEALDEAVIFGNALLMLQNPSGTFTNDEGREVFSAWYNCDIYVFDEERVQCLLFGRDTLKDEQQMLAAFGGRPPDIESSVHLAPFREND